MPACFTKGLSWDQRASLVPVDLSLGWGPMSDQRILDPGSITQASVLLVRLQNAAADSDRGNHFAFDQCPCDSGIGGDRVPL